MDLTNYLYSLKSRGAKLGLERVQQLVDVLGNPQNEFKSIVVGGTSGKGSTAIMLSSILKEAGFKVGTFTSPHLSSLTERIVVNGKKIPEKELARIVKKIKETIENTKWSEQPTFFEVITAAAFLYFKEQKVDFAVLEVGLGGRLDATNITEPVVSVITNISLEHMKILGNSIAAIAKEKAGIIRENRTLITAAAGKALEVFEKICKEKNSKIVRVGKEIVIMRKNADYSGQEVEVRISDKKYEIKIPFLGRHQLENAACAIGAAYKLEVDDSAITKGLLKAKWPGRIEIIQNKPMVILDCAKDAKAMERLKETISEDLKYNKLIVVLSISSDKNIQVMVNEIAQVADLIVISAHKVMERAVDPKIIAEEVERYAKNYVIVKDVKQAVKHAITLAEENDLVLITGSIFTVAEARELWHKETVCWGKEFNESGKF
ncbi:bifunctional folylpolyglutamate synthase/dihydrofolate synthase [Candidatus Micrarchaeota archaeon]|nr:bifunctional folylpolyglutamate synthase/dihydrofolate synthase [Candidatus Micrarchaeota archaeon]